MSGTTEHQSVRTHEPLSGYGDRCTFFEAVALGDVELLQEFAALRADDNHKHVQDSHFGVLSPFPVNARLLGNGSHTEMLGNGSLDANYTPPLKQQRGDTICAQVTAVENETSRESSVRVKVDVNVMNKHGETALMIASKFGRAAVVERLLQLGSNFSVACSRGNALTYAAANGHKNCIRLLVKAGCNPNASGLSWEPAVITAARSGYTDCVKALLEAGADPDARSHNGKTGLITATQWGHFNCAKTLLRFGAKVNSMSDAGDTALKWAARGGNTSLVRLLLQSGAEANTPSMDGTTALMFAAHASADCVRELVNAGADLHARNTRGQVPLFWAVNSGQVEIVQALLTAGADVNSVSTKGHTPLFYSVKNGDDDMNKTLLAAGANVNATDLKGKTPLLSAVQNYHRECLRTLLQAGADVNLADHSGRTPLMAAVMAQFTVAFNDLLAAGALVNRKDNSGRTALMMAASACNAPLCRDLVAYGACVNEQDNEGVTPLMVAAEKEIHCDTIKNILLNGGADVDIVDLQGKTALMYAISYNKNLTRLRLLTKLNLLNHQSDALVQCLESDDNCSALDKAAVLLQTGCHPVLPTFYRPLLLQKFYFPSSGRKKTYAWSFKKFILHGEPEMTRLFVSNGIVLKRRGTSGKSATRGIRRYYNSNLACALTTCSFNTANYLLANCYIFQDDLSFLRRFKSFMVPGQHQKAKETRQFIDELQKQPWPLVKLAFIAVSTQMGASPERAERVGRSGLPLGLQALLNFEQPVAALPVGDWSRLRLPCLTSRQQRPLLYFWPYGKELMCAPASLEGVGSTPCRQVVLRIHNDVSSDGDSDPGESTADGGAGEEITIMESFIEDFGTFVREVTILQPRHRRDTTLVAQERSPDNLGPSNAVF